MEFLLIFWDVSIWCHLYPHSHSFFLLLTSNTFIQRFLNITCSSWITSNFISFSTILHCQNGFEGSKSSGNILLFFIYWWSSIHNDNGILKNGNLKGQSDKVYVSAIESSFKFLLILFHSLQALPENCFIQMVVYGMISSSLWVVVFLSIWYYSLPYFYLSFKHFVSCSLNFIYSNADYRLLHCFLLVKTAQSFASIITSWIHLSVSDTKFYSIKNSSSTFYPLKHWQLSGFYLRCYLADNTCVLDFNKNIS